MSSHAASDVAVFGECDSDNVGDQLIAEGLLLIFERLGLTAESHPLEDVRPGTSGNAVATQRELTAKALHRRLYRMHPLYTHSVDAVQAARRWGSREGHAVRSVERARIVVIGGGQLFSDRTLRMLLRMDALCAAARQRQVPVLFMGVGASTPRTPLSKALFARILGPSPAGVVQPRDPASANVLGGYLKAVPSHAPDCAIPQIRKLAAELAGDSVSGRVGLAPMGNRSLPPGVSGLPVNQDDWWCELAERLIALGKSPVLFTTGVGDDHDRCLRLQGHLAAHGFEVGVAARPRDSRSFLKELQSFEAVLSQRLHCSISVYGIGGCPLSVSWDSKVESFFGEIGLPHRVLASDATPDDACRRLLRPESVPVGPEVLESRLMAAAQALLLPHQVLPSTVSAAS